MGTDNTCSISVPARRSIKVIKYMKMCHCFMLHLWTGCLFFPYGFLLGCKFIKERMGYGSKNGFHNKPIYKKNII